MCDIKALCHIYLSEKATLKNKNKTQNQKPQQIKAENQSRDQDFNIFYKNISEKSKYIKLKGFS